MTNSFNVSAGIAILSLMFCGAVSVHGIETVNLGTTADFLILTKTGVTTTAGGFITSDIGISPIAAAALTGFGLVLDSSATFSTSSLVEGHLYGADYSTPTSSKLTTAISDMETAFVCSRYSSLKDRDHFWFWFKSNWTCSIPDSGDVVGYYNNMLKDLTYNK